MRPPKPTPASPDDAPDDAEQSGAASVDEAELDEAELDDDELDEAELDDDEPDEAELDDDEPDDDEPDDDEPDDDEPDDDEPDEAELDDDEPDDDEPDDDEPDDAPGAPARAGRLTSRAHKAEVEAFANLAVTLVELPPYKLSDIGLPPKVHDAVVACRAFRKAARIRQLRWIATLLRSTELGPLTAAVADASGASAARRRRERAYERERQQLMEGGDQAVTDLVAKYPDIDRSHVRQLVRAAQRDPTKGKSKRAFRSLLQLVRAASEAAEARATPTPDADAG